MILLVLICRRAFRGVWHMPITGATGDFLDDFR